MRKIFLTPVVIAFMTVTLFIGCQSSSKKVEIAKDNVQVAEENVAEAKQELNEAVKDSIQLFRKESEKRIIANEKSLAEYKVKIATEKKESRARYEKEWAELVKKNNELKMRLKDFNEESEDKWESFKTEFNHDMDELGKAFKDLTVKNTK